MTLGSRCASCLVCDGVGWLSERNNEIIKICRVTAGFVDTHLCKLRVTLGSRCASCLVCDGVGWLSERNNETIKILRVGVSSPFWELLELDALGVTLSADAMVVVVLT